MHTRVKRMAERMHKLFDHFIYMLANADIFSQSSERTIWLHFLYYYVYTNTLHV